MYSCFLIPLLLATVSKVASQDIVVRLEQTSYAAPAPGEDPVAVLYMVENVSTDSLYLEWLPVGEGRIERRPPHGRPFERFRPLSFPLEPPVQELWEADLDWGLPTGHAERVLSMDGEWRYPLAPGEQAQWTIWLREFGEYRVVTLYVHESLATSALRASRERRGARPTWEVEYSTPFVVR